MTTRQVAIRVKTDGKAELKRDFQEVGQAGAAAQQQIAGATDKANAASDRQMEKWRQMARAAKEQQAVAERQAQFNAVLGVGGSGKSARDSAAAFEELLPANDGRRVKLSAMQRNTLVYTASDIFASAASGASPGMIAMQQGPQVLQAWAVGGEAASASMLKLFGLLGTGAVVVATATAAWLAHDAAMKSNEVTTRGLGATAGITGAQFEALAVQSAQLGEVSVSAAREMSSAYLSTGRIGGDVMVKLVALTKNYAVTTRQDAADATKELAKAFADPAKGVDALNEKLQFLDDRTYRYIQTLISQNRTTEAQIALADALGPKLLQAADSVSVLGGAWDRVKTSASNAFTAMGKAIDRALGGGTLAEQIARLDRERDKLQPYADSGSPAARGEIARLDAERARLRDQWVAQMKGLGEAQANQLAADARGVIGQVNPLPAKLRELQRNRATIQQAIDAGALSPEGVKEARSALGELEKEISAVKAGYASAAAQAAAAGKAERGHAKDAREAAREAKEAARQAAALSELELRNKLNIAKLAGEKHIAEELERQLRIRQLIQQFETAGVGAAEATARAERQVGAEDLADYSKRMKDFQDATKGIVLTRDTQQKLADMKVVFSESEAGLKRLKEVGESTFDTITDPRSWHDMRAAALSAIQDITAELFRLAATNPLKNMLFGTSAPTLSGGLLGGLFGGLKSSLLGGGGGGGGFKLDGFSDLLSIPGFANGTDSAPGGLAWVGERGRELVQLPRGAKVFSNASSERMLGSINIPITLNAQGAGPNEVQALKAEVAGLKRDLPGIIVSTTNDGIQRRIIQTQRG